MKAMKIMKCAAQAALRIQTELISKPVHRLDSVYPEMTNLPISGWTLDYPAQAFNERFSSCPSANS
jgi:hypothetical protein